MKPIGIKKLGRLSLRFCSVKRKKDLAELLGMARFQLEFLASQPEYFVFTIPKKDGTFRTVENPARQLKKVQRKLNEYLQAVYWHLRTDAAHGFLVVARNDPSPRHIVTNAERHLGCQWLLNIDFEDFFHHVSEAEVSAIFQKEPFHFKEALSDLLAKLACHRGRLPMGAPTSPVLSNLACIPLDRELLEFSKGEHWTFTRYADDLSFSGQSEISMGDAESIRGITEQHGFPFNNEKIKLRGPDDSKEVTGLLLRKSGVELPTGFIPGLEKEIRKLKTIIETQASQSQLKSAWVERYKQQVVGLLNFATHVMGKEDERSNRLLDAYEEATDPPEGLAAMNWLDFPYF